MYPSDNYGAKWVKGIINWVKDKTIGGRAYSSLIVEAMLECGLRRQKLIELINEFIESELIEVKEGMVYWCDVEIKTANPTTFKTKEKPKKEKKKKDDKNDVVEDLYKQHIEYCNANNEKPDTLEEFMKRMESEKRL